MNNIKKLAIFVALGSAAPVLADVGDPQIRTDHPSYPGELAFSTFDRLFETQAATYEQATGTRVDSDEQKALASWFWRNTHYWHGEAGRRDLWGEGLRQGRDMRLREYWNGLFGYGFGLCGTTHSQWTAELEYLLGHGRGRGVGAAGHNAFEVFLQGGAYGEGKWALLDHDLSTVIFNDSGQRLLGLGELQNDVDRWIDRGYKPEKQRGWLVCGLHPGDGNSYRKYAVAEYLAGYAGPPPMVHLRRGERMRRYFEPGLSDGKTFVFWGRNYNTGKIPGPERSRTWVNQPEQMHGSRNGTSHQNGQVRFANVQYVYRPDFTTADYREGIVAEGEDHVIFDFRTPYIIGATPPSDDAWGIYEMGCRNGLVLRGRLACTVAISLNAGRTWSVSQEFMDGLDLTDYVKGRSQYWLRLGANARQLVDASLEIRTVCQANVAVLPRLKDGGTTIRFEASGKAILSMGPELDLAKTFVTAGAFGGKSVTLTATPNKPVIGLHAAAHVASSSPPDPAIQYQIEYSLDSGEQWLPLVRDWSIPRRGDEPNDFWSQSFCYGSRAIESAAGKPMLIRFHNDGGKRNLRAEAHLILKAGKPDPVKVTYDWSDTSGEHIESHVFDRKGRWQLATGRRVRTRWVEFEPIP
ncbi:MAG: hypothetical protein QF918_02405 [Pirellulaceae bacterium]|nr:hypothetical protein [Pirellulaceae bacterium]MDP6557477.1 hypothetical protein [Pirellulaceae bacterium]MDP6722456.1 hypothetical protein [Pirellulaceae bacterium]